MTTPKLKTQADVDREVDAWLADHMRACAALRETSRSFTTPGGQHVTLAAGFDDGSRETVGSNNYARSVRCRACGQSISLSTEESRKRDRRLHG